MTVNNNANNAALLAEINRFNEINAAEGVSAKAKVLDTGGMAVTVTLATGQSANVVIGAMPEVDDPNGADSTIDQLNSEVDALKSSLKSANLPMTSATTAELTSAFFDIYQMIALLYEVAQKQRNVAGQMRAQQHAAIQTVIQSQAQTMMDAANQAYTLNMVGACSSAVMTAASAGMTCYGVKQQYSALKASDASTLQADIKGLQNEQMMAEQSKAAAASTKVEFTQDQITELGLENCNVADQKGVQAAFEQKYMPQTAEARKGVTAAQEKVDAAENNLGELQNNLNDAKTEKESASTELKSAKAELATARSAAEQDPTNVELQNKVTSAETRVQDAQNKVTAASDKVNKCTTEVNEASEELNQANIAKGEALTKLDTAMKDDCSNIKTQADAANAKANGAIKSVDNEKQSVVDESVNLNKDAQVLDKTIANAENSNGEDANKVLKAKAEATQYGKALEFANKVTTSENSNVLDAKIGAIQAKLDTKMQQLRVVSDQLMNSPEAIKGRMAMQLGQSLNELGNSVRSILQATSEQKQQLANADVKGKDAVIENTRASMESMGELYQESLDLMKNLLQERRAIQEAESNSINNAIHA